MFNDRRVYVVDDDDSVRDSLDFLLAAAGFLVTPFASAKSFLDAFAALDSGCLITDVRMPGIGGVELLKRVKHEKPMMPVIVMTGHGDVPLAVEAMKAGAADFVEKPFEDKRLVEAVRLAFESATHASDARSAADELAVRVASLSNRERQVLDGLVAGLTNKEVAIKYDISPRTIEVYRSNVMTKMRAANLPELVRLAIKSGLVSD